MNENNPPGARPDLRRNLLKAALADLMAALACLKRTPGRTAVHGARVATRRLRAVLRALRRDLHPVLYASAQFDLKHLGRSLGRLREVTVRRQGLRSLQRAAKPLPGESPEALQAVQEDLASAEGEQRAAVAGMQRSPAWSARLARIAAALDPDSLLMPADDCGEATVRRAQRKVLENLADRLEEGKITQEALHAVRLAAKRARYVCDAIAKAGSSPEPAEGDILTLLRRLQTTLGEINDLFQLTEWLANAQIDPAIKRDLNRWLELKLAARQTRFRKMRKAAHKRFKAAAKDARRGEGAGS